MYFSPEPEVVEVVDTIALIGGLGMSIPPNSVGTSADFVEYNSVIQNTTPDGQTLTGGGVSGLLTLGDGDGLEWECEFDNDLDTPLIWANEAYTAEMCNLVGMYAPSTGRPWSCNSF